MKSKQLSIRKILSENKQMKRKLLDVKVANLIADFTKDNKAMNNLISVMDKIIENSAKSKEVL